MATEQLFDANAKPPPVIQRTSHVEPIVDAEPVNALAETRRVDAPLAFQSESASLFRLMERVIDRPDAIGALERLIALRDRMDAKHAEREFNSAMAAFQSECPPIVRRHDTQFSTVTAAGVKTVRKFADLEDIATTIGPCLSRHGLSYRWSDAKVANNLMTQACILSHVGGHSIQSELSLPLASSAGASEAQKYAAVSTYLRRYTLVSVLGLTSCDDDADGADPIGKAEIVTEQQARTLNDLLIALAEAEKTAGKPISNARAELLKAAGAATLDAVPADKFEHLCSTLERRRKAVKPA